MTDEWELIVKEREDWKHFLNEVVGPFSLGAALSSVATKNPNLYAALYMMVLFSMTYYKTNRYSSLYFKLVNKPIKTVPENYMSKYLQEKFFSFAYMKGLWLYLIGFITLGLIIILPEPTLKPAKLFMEMYLYLILAIVSIVIWVPLIVGRIKRRKELNKLIVK